MSAVREKIRSIVKGIQPFDDKEALDISETLAWIDSGVEIFRVKKPDTPNKHLVSYFCVYDVEQKKLLLVDHIKAQLWLPAGGHVDVGENPKTTARRECREELDVEANFMFGEPIFITANKTVGLTAPHTDVSLWYVLSASQDEITNFDRREFNSIKWFSLDEVPLKSSDPQMGRFIAKFKSLL